MNEKVKRHPVIWALATGCGFGYSPIASGTVGSLWGIPIVYAMQFLPGLTWQIIVAAVLSLVAIPICDAAEPYFNKKDPGFIVADEYLTFPICMLGLPFEPWVIVMCFCSCRFFDILKPPPARGLERLKGGLGITIDDIIASVYSLGANHLAFWVITTYVLKHL